MPFPLMMEQEGIIVGVIDFPGVDGNKPRQTTPRKTPNPQITVSLLRALADKIEKYAVPEKETG